MKSVVIKKIVLLYALTGYAIATLAQGYKITLQAPQYKRGIAYLTYHMGPNLNLVDSAAMASNGIAIFKGKEKLPSGIYVVVLPGRTQRIELLLEKAQLITIKVDTTDLINKTIVTGSPANTLYVQYQKFVTQKAKLLNTERVAYMNATTRADSLLHEANYKKHNTELNNYRENLVKTQPNAMISVLFKAMKEPEVPYGAPVTQEDTLRNYYYYKSHYWDGVTFMDDRIIRSPFFVTRFERYYRDVIQPVADTIIKDIDYKLLLARNNTDMYMFLLNWFTDEYINPKYMGLDRVFVHLFEKYHSKGLTKWLDQKQMETITRRAYMLMANLVGDKAANLEMLDINNKAADLYNTAADYTVVCFWDPTCGHCKDEVPRLDSIYQASWKKHNVKIFAVLSPQNGSDSVMSLLAEWKKFIADKKLTEWTHVYKTKEMEDADYKMQRPSFRQLYDIRLTPTLYLLGKDKNIIGKNLTIQQLNELLEVKWKN
jgi:thiol-disulfide isomerase/thioredoxin